jgi:hypothetical protein
MMNCRPISVRRALEAAGCKIRESEIERMWVPMGIVPTAKEVYR